MKKYIAYVFVSALTMRIGIAQDKPAFTVSKKMAAINAETCDELMPVLHPSGKILFWSTAYCNDNIGGSKAGMDIRAAKLDSLGNWIITTFPGFVVNNEYDNVITGFSGDGKKAYFQNVYKLDGKMMPGLSSASFNPDSGFNTPSEIILKGLNFKRNALFSFSISANGKHMLISKPKNDTIQNEDLFISHLDIKGNWSEPISLGDDINSLGYDFAPFLASDDSTLYFSTNGRGGFGDADIFLSRRLDDTWQRWTRPINLGKEINGKGFDAYFIEGAENNCYYSRSLEPNKPSDLYTTLKIRPYTVVALDVKSAKTNQPIQVTTVTCFSKETKQPVAKVVTDKSPFGMRLSHMPGNYYFVTHAEGYISLDESFSIPNMMINKDTSVQIALTPIEVGQTVRLNNIYFETGKAELLPESFTELDILVELLQENPTLEIMITGHTDNRGNPKANQLLSENRVKSVEAYVQSKGIEAARLSYKGFGSTKPIADNKTEEGRAKNRRVEFMIVKK